ncbi:MAG: hypothetical protein N2691_01250 [Patescibacteria group bacterium]|nr:hypothetical protein [Patescibacteria group bacterium]
MEAILKNKALVAAGVVVVIILAIFGVLASRSSVQPSAPQTATKEEAEEAPVPTVDSSVKVTLEPLNSNREVKITVNNAPKGTNTIDVEMSYETTDQSLEGVIGQIKISDGSGTEKFTLGTCSSGTCRYHSLASDIRLVLKFNGDYGEKIFENSYAL